GRTLFYRLKQIDINGLTEYSRIIEVDVPFTDGFYLKQNYPNPFNNSTVISYSLTEESLVSLKLYNISGEEIYSLINQKQLPGEYQFRLDVSNISSKKPLSSGIYIYKLQAGSRSIFRKLIFLK
ncbi:MAG: T9SS type A sorting domain-containing protein, partial [Bacillota bacterium]